MLAREIPPQQWYSFLGKFAYRHFGWNVTLERKSRQRAKLLAARHAFLEELITDVEDGQRHITIVLGSPFDLFHTHVINEPVRVRAAAGAQAALEIDSADGSTVVVHFRRRESAI